MSILKKVVATVVIGLLDRAIHVIAQEVTARADELTVPDSTHMMQQFMSDAVVKTSGSGNTVLFIAIGVVVVAGAAYFFLKR
jgi:LPXTG-motif cell wall-anchored protein